MEIWKDIVGYKGLYQVSNRGRVRSLDRVSIGHPLNGDRKLRQKVLSGRPNKQGYLTVMLYNNDGGRQFFIHHLVAKAFISNPNNFAIVRHYPDPTVSNNATDNLRWGTHQDNSNDTVEMNRQAKGEDIHTHVLLDSDIPDIWERLCRGESCQLISECYGVDRGTIHAIRKGVTWRQITSDLGGSIPKKYKNKVLCETKKTLAVDLMINCRRSTRYVAKRLNVSKSFAHKLKRDYERANEDS